MTPVLAIRDFSLRTVDGAELTQCGGVSVARGAIVALVGPSGSGKTTLLRAIAGALPDAVGDRRGTLSVLGREVLALHSEELKQFRRRYIGFVGQDPASRLNPYMRVGRLLAEASGHQKFDTRQVLADVGLPATDELLRRKPGQLSGGQQRRLALARALVRRPDLLLLDEPTVGLDAQIRERLCELLRDRASQGTTIVLSSHDTAFVERLADEVVALGAHTAVPEPVTASGKPVTTGAEILRVDGLSAWARTRRRSPILHDIDVELTARGALAVVGASGAGKTTLARAITGLHKHVQGRVHLDNQLLPLTARNRRPVQRRRIQLIPQDPLGTLNPSRSVGATLSRPLLMHRGIASREIPIEVAGLLETVELPADFAERYPHELSGGQRQRVAIARAIAADPDVLVCDEITSSLDASTGNDIMNVLGELRSRRGLALIVITHDIPLAVRHTDSVIVVDAGRIVERGATADILHTASKIEQVPTRADVG